MKDESLMLTTRYNGQNKPTSSTSRSRGQYGLQACRRAPIVNVSPSLRSTKDTVMTEAPFYSAHACRNCGEPVEPGYGYCRSCLEAAAARDEAWRQNMNPKPVEPVEVEPSTDDNDHDPFDARDLRHVCDRVVTPFLLDTPDGVITVHGVDQWAHYTVEVLDADGDVAAFLDPTAQVELVGPVTVLDAPSEVRAYYADGDLLCADHGAPFDIGVSDGAVSPIFDGLDAVEWCSAGSDHGHSFCGSCGTDVEPTGHPDSGFAGPLFHCENCSANAVRVEDSHVSSSGWEHVHGFDGLLDDHVVTVSDVPGYVSPFGWSSRLNPKPSGTVDAVRDASPWNRFGMNTSFFVAWVDDDPTAGVLLVLDTTGSSAWDEAFDYFEDAVLSDLLSDYNPDIPEDVEDAEEVRSDFRASVQCVRVARDAVEVTRKP